MKKNLTLLASAFLLMMSPVMAQINMPQPSPLSTVEQKVGLTDVSVTYSRPSMKGRAIFGDIVPFDKIWRTGANASTKITFSDEVSLEGNKVPAGTYALYTIPGKESWTIILNKNTNLWGEDGYSEAEDQVRVTVKPVALAEAVETFAIQFVNLTKDGASLELAWEKTAVRVAITTEVDAKVMADIKSKLAENPSVYFQAATYYYENDKDLAQALAWCTKACDLRKDAFWMSHVKAKIQLKMKDYKGALATAEASLATAKAAPNDFGYVNNNEKLIAEIKAASKK
ncbi:DUF2911 domain-containing protein [Cytophagales bacterium LB-30]|uniref:DUF2911 domain-containing protein n=1 Tax=Shiella aurantiaca TaxID=3058365 RepID=A0ABT8F4K4_9BACT|nr:DUF2911 domain-containing protein [Shiella aurantiaca]MDN4165377.1 DUF2911 domain-containing protein [Shiella aurantiaca]